MLSHRIVVYTPPPVQTYTAPDARAKFQNQWEYEEWLKEQPHKIGMLYVGKYINSVIGINDNPAISVLVRRHEDYLDLTYNYKNVPNAYMLAQVYALRPDWTYTRWTTLDDERRLTQEEIEWLLRNDLLQNSIKQKYPDLSVPELGIYVK